MTQLAESQSAYRAAFEQVQQETPDSGSGLAALRERAFNRFTEWGFPTTKLEPWRFTTSARSPRAICPGPCARGRGRPRSSCPLRPARCDLTGRLRGWSLRASVVEPGRPARGRRDSEPRDVLAADPTSLEPHLGQLAGFEGAASSFTALNTGLLHDGVVVRVGRAPWSRLPFT